MIRLDAPLRRIGGDDEFFVFARGVAPGGDGRTRCRVRACRNWDRRPQYACGRRARACVRAREQGGARGHARRLRRAARLRRRNAGRPRLSEGPRGLRPALPHSHRGKLARDEGRVPAEIGGSFGAWRRAADRCDALQALSVAFGDTFPASGRGDAPRLPQSGVERRPSLGRLSGKGERARFSPVSAKLSAGGCGSARACLRRGHARGARKARRWRRSSARRSSRPTTR